MVKAQRELAVKMLSFVGVWGIIGAIFLPIYKADSALWISVLMFVVAIVAMGAAFKLVGIEYPEKPHKKSAKSDEDLNPVVMTGAAVVVADEASTGSGSSDRSSGSESGPSSSFSSSSYDSGGSSSSSD